MSFADKAVCVAKNLQTGQIYQAMIAKRSYSLAKKELTRFALSECAKAHYNLHSRDLQVDSINLTSSCTK